VRNKFADTFLRTQQGGSAALHRRSPTSRRQARSPSFRQEFPERFINTGVAEQIHDRHDGGHGAARACGPSPTPLRPFQLYRPFEMVRDDLCYQKPAGDPSSASAAGVTYSTLGRHPITAQEDVSIACLGPQSLGRGALAILRKPKRLRAGARCRRRARSICAWARPVSRISRRRHRSLGAFGKIRMIKPGTDCLPSSSYGPIMKRAFAVADRIEAAGKSVAIAFGSYLEAAGPGRRIEQILAGFKHCSW